MIFTTGPDISISIVTVHASKCTCRSYKHKFVRRIWKKKEDVELHVAEKKNRNKGWSEYAGALCHTKNSLDKCHKCVTRIPIIEEHRDGCIPLCHHRNKEQSEYFDTNV